MAKSPETKFCMQSYPYKGTFFEEVHKTVLLAKNLEQVIWAKQEIWCKITQEITPKIWILEKYSSNGKIMDVNKLCLCDGVSFLLYAVTVFVFNKASVLYGNSLLL